MLSRHFLAHNLNVPEMRLLFSLRCADPGIFVRGGEGCGRPDCRKTTATTLFLTLNWFYSFTGGGSSIFQGGPTFSRGEGGPDAYFHKNANNLWFSRGVRAPCPPSGSAHVWAVIATRSQHKYPRVPVIATRCPWERSGWVVECLTRDRRVAGSSLTGVTALWSLSKTHIS